MKKTLKGLAIAVGASVTFGAQASYIGLDLDTLGPGDVVTVPEYNDYAYNPDTGANAGAELTVGQEGWGSATVNALQDGPFKLTFTYLFTEASFTNEFHYGGNLIFSTADNSFGDTYTTTYNGGAGALDFFFRAFGYVNTLDIHNVDNNDSSTPNFHTFWEAGSNSLIISLDDHGAGPDDNHDDMIIRITASPVPEPGTLALLGLGLAGMGLGLRRRSKA